ncbi:MAG: hypothetical protein IJ191_00085 [Treponema sp.]|nr:hypothetical protein [Treponema sp.]
MSNEEWKTLVTEFIDTKTINALDTFIAADDSAACSSQTDVIARVFGATDTSFLQSGSEQEQKLIQSFKNNLSLLVEKTWVEKSDIELKEHVLYQVGQFYNNASCTWKDSYVPFLDMINKAVQLMFGQQPHSEQFNAWAFRIDPEFGIFWWYISSLPHDAVWSEEKCRIAILLGMYFLANY